ncbi:molybdopterin-dependent oxidoreductase [Pirellulales bacterium]|nr:molybdopterin-dependent oxidoreductase [Pirellulales bacterium]
MSNGPASHSHTLLSVSRREFLAGLSAGSLVLMARSVSGQSVQVVRPDQTEAETFDPDLFVSVSPDSTVTILAHRSEMGTGIRTALPRIVADELEADWDRVVIRQAIADKRLGSQNTDGSNSVRHFFTRMRIAGATTRTMLEQAAAQQWGVPPEECHGKNHAVVHTDSGLRLGYGDLVAVARTLDVPDAKSLTMKSPDEWKYIGKDAPITDMDKILTGKAIYGIDAKLDNQLYAVIARPPVVGGKVKQFDAADAMSIAGVSEIVEVPGFSGAPAFQPLGGIAVCATSTWAAIQGRDALKIEWEDGPNGTYDSTEYSSKLAASANRPGEVVRNAGDVSGPLSGDAVFSADYTAPHLAHAPMEPPAAVADVQTDASGRIRSCVVTAATQTPQSVQRTVAGALGLKPEEVIVNVTLLGAGFGRKSKPDYCVEAALLSKNLGRPVHVLWTREDDIQHDYYHAVSHIHSEAALNDKGKVVAWLQRVAYPPIMSTFDVRARRPPPTAVENGAKDVPFDIPNILIESCDAEARTRIGWYRSVQHVHQNFANSSFADELAHQSGRDPLEFLLDLLGDDRHIDLKAANLRNRGASHTDYPYDVGRLKSVTRRCAEQAKWDRRRSMPKGRGLGIACCRSFVGYTCHVVEVEVGKDGKIQIPDVWLALDVGVVVSPDRVRAQAEGGAIFAATHALHGKITFTNGRADQSNFDDYPAVRMDDGPQKIHVELVDSDAAPSGVGETTVPSFAPALCNAIFSATGQRIRNLPILDHDLSWT